MKSRVVQVWAPPKPLTPTVAPTGVCASPNISGTSVEWPSVPSRLAGNTAPV